MCLHDGMLSVLAALNSFVYIHIDLCLSSTQQQHTHARTYMQIQTVASKIRVDFVNYS